jgi:hypothetical protein
MEKMQKVREKVMRNPLQKSSDKNIMNVIKEGN